MSDEGHHHVRRVCCWCGHAQLLEAGGPRRGRMESSSRGTALNGCSGGPLGLKNRRPSKCSVLRPMSLIFTTRPRSLTGIRETVSTQLRSAAHELEADGLRFLVPKGQRLGRRSYRFEVFRIVPLSFLDVVNGDGQILPRRKSLDDPMAAAMGPCGRDKSQSSVHLLASSTKTITVPSPVGRSFASVSSPSMTDRRFVTVTRTSDSVSPLFNDSGTSVMSRPWCITDLIAHPVRELDP